MLLWKVERLRWRGYISSQIRYKTEHHTLVLEADGLIRLSKGRQSPRRIQDGLVAFFRRLECNRITKTRGFRLFNNPEHCTHNRILSRHPVLDEVLFGCYMLTTCFYDVEPCFRHELRTCIDSRCRWIWDCEATLLEKDWTTLRSFFFLHDASITDPRDFFNKKA